MTTETKTMPMPTNLGELLTAIWAGRYDEGDGDDRPQGDLYVGNNTMTSLPTFGGRTPRDTSGVWSWDADSLLVGASVDDMRILTRQEAFEAGYGGHPGPARVSLDNGNRYYTVEELAEIDATRLEQLWDALAQAMEDEAREQAHAECAPCDDATFLRRYLELASDDLVIG